MRPAALVWMLAAGVTAATAQDRTLDDFDDLSAWKVSATDDVTATLRSIDGKRGQGALHRLRLRPRHRLCECAPRVTRRLSGAL